jgi:hypothetical protein
MQNIKKITSIIFIVVIIGGIGIAIALNWSAINSLVRGAPEKQAPSMTGQSIDIEIGSKNYSVPPVFNGKVFTYLSKELNEKGGLPVQVNRKGNALPFGIPL